MEKTTFLYLKFLLNGRNTRRATVSGKRSRKRKFYFKTIDKKSQKTNMRALEFLYSFCPPKLYVKYNGSNQRSRIVILRPRYRPQFHLKSFDSCVMLKERNATRFNHPFWPNINWPNSNRSVSFSSFSSKAGSINEA